MWTGKHAASTTAGNHFKTKKSSSVGQKRHTKESRAKRKRTTEWKPRSCPTWSPRTLDFLLCNVIHFLIGYSNLFLLSVGFAKKIMISFFLKQRWHSQQWFPIWINSKLLEFAISHSLKTTLEPQCKSWPPELRLLWWKKLRHFSCY